MKITAYILLTLVAINFSSPAHSGEFSGYIGGQTRNFFEDPLNPEQHNNYLSAVAEPEFFARGELFYGLHDFLGKQSVFKVSHGPSSSKICFQSARVACASSLSIFWIANPT